GVSFMTGCLGPVASAVMKGRLTSVSSRVESSILAFSEASLRRCSAIWSLVRSMPCSLRNSAVIQRIMDWITAEFRKEQGIDLTKDQMALQRLKEASEKAKMELSTLLETEVNLPFITADATGPKHPVMKLTP